ncbi:MAG: PRC-barrel domain-containing protein [Thermoplasmata archaeon]|nr:PRC-barrel domain-containing protein [Thermoplasmata archaeon]
MISAKKINGMRVVTADAFTVGEVDGLEVDQKTWNVTHLDIELSDESLRELGFKKPLLGAIRICLPVSHINKFGDVITLKSDLAHLKGLDACKKSK